MHIQSITCCSVWALLSTVERFNAFLQGQASVAPRCALRWQVTFIWCWYQWMGCGYACMPALGVKWSDGWVWWCSWLHVEWACVLLLSLSLMRGVAVCDQVTSQGIFCCRPALISSPRWGTKIAQHYEPHVYSFCIITIYAASSIAEYY